MDERDNEILDMIARFMKTSKTTSYKVSNFKNEHTESEFTKITINFRKDVDK